MCSIFVRSTSLFPRVRRLGHDLGLDRERHESCSATLSLWLAHSIWLSIRRQVEISFRERGYYARLPESAYGGVREASIFHFGVERGVGTEGGREGGDLIFSPRKKCARKIFTPSPFLARLSYANGSQRARSVACTQLGTKEMKTRPALNSFQAKRLLSFFRQVIKSQSADGRV